MKVFPLLFLSFLSLQLSAQSVSFSNQSALLSPTTGFTTGDCTVDMNGDFLDDVVRVSSTVIFIDFQQPDGSFQQTEYEVNIEALPDWSLCAGDLDNNGFNDLCLGNGSRVSFVLANADGTAYTETVMPGYIFSQRSTMADINNDGKLDAFVCHDVDQSIPYRNLGNGVMQADQTLIVTNPLPGNYAAIWTDYDNDADIDLYVTKCRGGAQPGDPARTNRLYRNNGDGTFDEVAEQAGLADNAQSWSTVFEDFDNDGDFDAFIVNHDFQNRLYRNNGDGTFTDVIQDSGINPNDLGAWENASGDFNNDGFMDIFSEMSMQLYLGNGDLTFTGQNLPVMPGAIADLNNDGFLDVQRWNDLWMNEGNDNNWLKINTVGIQSNRNGIGARVEIYGDFGVRIREVRSGQSFSPMSSLQTHFGIGAADHINLLVVKWPSGMVTSVENPAINTTIDVPETGCLLAPSELIASGDQHHCPGAEVELVAPEGFTYNWSNGATTQSIITTEAGSFSVLLSDTSGCVSFSNTVVTSIIQEVLPVISASGDIRFCEGGSVTLTSTESSTYVWSNGESTQSITVSESGDYKVDVASQCYQDLLPSEIVQVEVLANSEPIVNGITIGTGDSVLLEASGDSLYWYNAALGGTLLGTGDQFQTPALDGNTTYFVESHSLYPGQIQPGGKPDNSGGGGLPTQGGYVLFDVWEEMTIESVTVYVPMDAPFGERNIRLVDAGGNILGEVFVSLEQGQHEVQLGFTVPEGIGFSLRCPQNNLYRNNGGVSYPYLLGDMGQMTASNFGAGFYYYFYDWKVRKESYECISERVPVEVMVSDAGDVFLASGLQVYPNPATGRLFIHSKNAGSGLVRLFDAVGKEVLRREITDAQTLELDVENWAAGIYQVQLEMNGKIAVRKVVVE